jgi:hypothetical protein
MDLDWVDFDISLLGFLFNILNNFVFMMELLAEIDFS